MHSSRPDSEIEVTSTRVVSRLFRPFSALCLLAMVAFTLSNAAGLAELETYLASRSYITGCAERCGSAAAAAARRGGWGAQGAERAAARRRGVAAQRQLGRGTHAQRAGRRRGAAGGGGDGVLLQPSGTPSQLPGVARRPGRVRGAGQAGRRLRAAHGAVVLAHHGAARIQVSSKHIRARAPPPPSLARALTPALLLRGAASRARR